MDGVFVLLLLVVALAVWHIRDQVRIFDASAYKRETGRKWWRTVSDKGANGEYELGRTLEKGFPGCKLLFNVYIPKSGGENTEIDVLMITTRGLYVFESKNYSGWVFGNEDDKNWTVTLNSRVKNRFYNPIKQNAGHVKWLCKYLGVERDMVRSIVVFGERCELKKIKSSGLVPVVQRRRAPYVVRDFEKESDCRLTPEQQELYYQKLRGRCNLSEAERRKHIENVKRKVK